MKWVMLAMMLGTVACRDKNETRCRVTEVGYDLDTASQAPRYFFSVTYVYQHADKSGRFTTYSKESYERAQIDREHRVGDDYPCWVDGPNSARFRP